MPDWEVLTDEEPTGAEREEAEHLLEVLTATGVMYGSTVLTTDGDVVELLAFRVTDEHQVAVVVRPTSEATVAMTRIVE